MKNFLLIAVFGALLIGCGNSEPAVDPKTGNPANETPAQYRERIEKSSMPPDEKKRKLEEIDNMAKMNEEMLKRGAPSTPRRGN
jgi:hypothetical protein